MAFIIATLRSNLLTKITSLSNIMKKSELLESAKSYLVPIYKEYASVYICNSLRFVPFADISLVMEVTRDIQHILNESHWDNGCSITVQTIEMTPTERYHIRLMFMDFLILMYKDEGN